MSELLFSESKLISEEESLKNATKLHRFPLSGGNIKIARNRKLANLLKRIKRSGWQHMIQSKLIQCSEVIHSFVAILYTIV